MAYALGLKSVVSSEKAVSSGELKHRVYIMEEVISATEGGGSKSNWVRYYTNSLWAKIDNQQSSEFTYAHQQTPENSYLITMRDRGPAVKPLRADLVVYWPLNNRVFSITGFSTPNEVRGRNIRINAMERRDVDTRTFTPCIP